MRLRQMHARPPRLSSNPTACKLALPLTHYKRLSSPAYLGSVQSDTQVRLTVVTRASQRDEPRGVGPVRSTPELLLNECLELVRKRDLDGLIHLLDSREILAGVQPDIDDHELDFEELLEAMLLLGPSRQVMDSYAIRNLVLTTPGSFEVLSTLTMPGRFVQRCAVTSRFGEESILTFTLDRMVKEPPTVIPDKAPAPPSAHKQDDQGKGSQSIEEPSAAGTSQGSAPADADGRKPEEKLNEAGHESLTAGGTEGDVHRPAFPPMASGEDIWKQWAITDVCASDSVDSSEASNSPEMWKLSSIRGEPQYPMLPLGPSPEFSPESIVSAQLHYLQQNPSKAYYFLSPSCRRAIGPWGPQRFVRLMSKHESYCHLINHSGYTSLRRCQNTLNTYLEVVLVQKETGGLMPWCWVLTKQDVNSAAFLGDTIDLDGSWLIDSVQPIVDPEVLEALGLPTMDE